MRAHQLSRSFSVIPLLIGAATIAACNGQIGTGKISGGGNSTGSAGNNGGTGNGSGGGPATGPSGGPAVPIATTGTPPAESAGTLVMRRLSYPEYDHMLADLLGDTTAPAEGGNAWSPDAPNAVGYVAPNNVADLQVDLYNQTADTVVDTAFQALAAGKTAGKLAIPCRAPANAAAETTCATQFITTFGLQAYRRPISAAEQTDLLALFTKVRGLGLSFNASLGAVTKGMVQSPNFLYHWEIGPTKPVAGADGLVPLTAWQVASRLAATLWLTTPDDALLQAAQAGKLSAAADVSAQVMRMLADPRAANGLFSFHSQWLFNFGSQGRDITQPLTKSSPLFNHWRRRAGRAASASSPSSSRRFTAVTGPAMQSLFTAPYSFINHDLGVIYGGGGPGDTALQRLRSTRPSAAASSRRTAFPGDAGQRWRRDNPVYRGLSVYLKVLCGTIGSPSPPMCRRVTFKANGTTRTVV